MVDEDKERLYYTLGQEADIKTLRHIKRYDFVVRQILKLGLKPKRILDFGCGSGYGTKLMATAFPNVNLVGYDISKDAIEYANENNAVNNIEFVTKLPNNDNNDGYDIIILMDMIEHMTDKTRNGVLKDLMTQNQNANTFFISTPLYDFTGKSKVNKYHINCFTKQAFKDYLGDWFKTQELWLVDWCYTRLVSEKDLYGGVVATCQNMD